MKKIIKALSIILCLFLTLGLAACGNKSTDGSTPAEGMAAEELSGVWIDENRNMLQLDVVENTYIYRTWYGRIGSGFLLTPENNGETRQLDFADFIYDFTAEDGGFGLSQNGGGDGESLDGAHFKKSDGEIPTIPLKTLDGMWQNAAGETLVIDTERMQYIACSEKSSSGGTIAQKDDGKGPYLFLNGYAYPRISANGSSFELFFSASDTQTPDGTFSGVFYKDAKADEYTRLDKKEFLEQDGHMWYYDGVQYYALPDGYTVADDGLAYDENGNRFAAGWKSKPYNPADNWGENWADNWDE